MKRSIKKAFTVLTLIALVLSAFTVCAHADTAPKGSLDNPWYVGQTPGTDEVYAYFDGYALQIIGTGKMMDFENPEDLFWKDIASDINSICITDTVTSVGKNAFRKVGTGDFFSIELGSGIEEVGDYAFYNCPFTDLDIPAAVTNIGSHAFKSNFQYEEESIRVYYAEKPESIAVDAFEGSNYTFYYLDGTGWNNSNMLNYGAIDSAYVKGYRVITDKVYGDTLLESDEDFYFEDMDTFFCYASPVIDNIYVFDKWIKTEGVSGITDLGSNEANAYINSNAHLVASYTYEPNYCPIDVLKDGQPAEEGKDYTWSLEDELLTIHTSGLTIKQKHNIFVLTSGLKTDPSVNSIEFEDIMILPYSSRTEPLISFGGDINLKLKGYNPLCCSGASIIYTDGKLTLSGDGILIVSNDFFADVIYPAIIAKDFEAKDFTIGGYDFDFNIEDLESLTETELKTWEDNTQFKTFYDKGTNNLTAGLFFMGPKEKESPDTGDSVLLIAAAAIFSISAALWFARKKEK